MNVLVVAVASLAPTIAALAAWRRPLAAAALERIELRLDDMLEWQVSHDRAHIVARRPRNITGGMQ